MLINIEDLTAWDHLHNLTNRRRPFTDEESADEAEAWVHAVYIPTPRDLELRRAIQRTMQRNGATKRHWLAIDGVTNTGKSEMLLRFAMEFQRAAKGMGPPTTYAHVPVVFVQADSGQQGAGLLHAIADFAGVPAHGNEDKIRRRLARVLPAMRTRVIVVDDAHMLRRASRRATKLTDSLRATLRIPATFVFAGAGMHNSALLQADGTSGYESADQLRSRHSILAFQPLRLPKDAELLRRLIGDYIKLVATVLPHLEVPFRSDNKALAELVRRTEGHVGSLMGALKDATVESIRTDHVLTSDRLLEFATIGALNDSPAP